jgi:hypothetical protein
MRITEAVVTALLLLIIFCGRRDFIELTAKFVIVLAGLFACMAVVEFFLLLAFPNLLPGTISSRMNLKGTDQWTVFTPLAYLGMTTGDVRYIGGVGFPRMSSFLREPSVMPPVFLLPGALALTFRSRVRLWAIPIFAFAFLGFAGSVYAPVAFAIIAALAMKLPVLGKRAGILSAAAFSAVILILVLIYRTTYIDDLLSVVFTYVSEHQQSLDFLDKWGSAVIRMRAGREFLASGLEGGFDRPNIAIAAVGLMLYSYAHAGMVAALLMAWHLFRTFHAACRYRIHGGGSLTASALIIGVFIQAGFMNNYGFMNASGFIIMALILARARQLTPATGRIVRVRRRGRQQPVLRSVATTPLLRSVTLS